MNMPAVAGEALAEREIVSSRLFAAAPARVFAAWIDPVKLATWWGPNGFTNTFTEFDPRPGGEWIFVMHGPNGIDYPNRSVFVEVVPVERIVFDHVVPPLFRVTATFEPRGEGTFLTFRMTFDSAETCARIKDIVVPANEQNFDRLTGVLETMP